MESEADSYHAIDIANAVINEMAKKGLDPVVCYGALVCAFLQLHLGLGHGKQEWMEVTRAMSKTTWAKQ